MSIQFHAVVPQFTVSDLVKTAEYYRDVFGFTIAGYWNDPPVFGIVHRDEIEIFFNQARNGDLRTGRAPGAYDMYIRVSGVDALAAELQQRHAKIVDGPVDRVYKQREVVVEDCNGLVLCFGEDTSGR